jgi:hypothetical protein
VEACLAGAFLAEACPAEAFPVGACLAGAFLAEVYPAEAFPVGVYPAEAHPVEAFPVEACPAEACPAEACLVETFPAVTFLATDKACLVGDNKESFPVEAVAYVFQDKAVAASVLADNIECRRVAVVASCKAWVDQVAEVSVRGAGGWNLAVAVFSASVAAAAVSGARDKVASED